MRSKDREAVSNFGLRRFWSSPALNVVAFFGLVAAAFFAPALVTGRVLLPVDVLFLYPPWQSFAAQFGVALPHNHLIADTILQNYSWKALAAQAYSVGQFPLWNPYILTGQPFLAAGQSGSLYPPGLLFYILPNGLAYAWFMTVHFALGGILAYWHVRVLGGTRFGGVVGGVTFAFCGYLVVSVLWPMVVSTAIWLPGLLAVLELVIRRICEPGRGGRPHGQSSWSILLLLLAGAGMVTLQFLAGHLEMSLYLLLAAGLYTAIRLATIMFGAWRTRPVGTPAAALERTEGNVDERAAGSDLRRSDSGGRPSSSLRRVVLAGLLLFSMVALGSLGAGAQLVPFAEAISANVRSGQVSFDDVRSYALPRQHLAAFVAPDFFGNPSHHAVFDIFSGVERAVDRPLTEAVEQRWGTEWGPKNYVEGTAYLGILPLLLAAIAVVVRRDGITLALGALAALSLLLAFGTPLYGLLFYGLPGVNQLHTPFRWIYPYSVCLAALAGLGASVLQPRQAAGGGLASRWRQVEQPSDPSWLRLVSLDASATGRVVGWLAVALGALGALGLTAAWVMREPLFELAERAMRRSEPLRDAFSDARLLYSYEWTNLFGLVLLLLASGLAILALVRRAPFARVLALAVLLGDLFTFGAGFNTAADPAPLSLVPPSIAAINADNGLFRITTLGEDDALPANTNMLFGLQDIRGYDTIISRDYVRFLELVEPQTGLLYSKVSKLLQPRSLDSPLLDLLNVKYVLTTLRVDHPDWLLVHDGDLRVYQNQQVIPRAFLVEQAVGAADFDEALRLVARPSFDPRQEVVLEGEVPSLPTVEKTGFGFEGSVGPVPQVVNYSPNRVTVQALSLRPSYLVLTDMHVPGWTVKVSGADQPLLRADGIFRAVRLEPGSHEITFEYKPLSFRLGLLLSALAIGLASLALGIWAYEGLGVGGRTAHGPVGRVLKNSLFPMVTGLINRAFDFGFALIYLRLLGPQGAGAFTFAVAVVGYFDILVNFGLSTLVAREVARRPAELDRYFVNTLVVRTGLAVLALLAALVVVGPLAGWLQIGPELGLAIVVFTLGMLPGALASTASAVFMARERMEVPAAVTMLTTLIKIGLGTAVLLAGWGIVGLAIVSLVVNLITAMVLGGLMVGLLGRPRLSFELPFCRGLLVQSWPLMLNNLLNSIFFRIDAVLLKPLAGDVALGHYSTAYKFIDGLQIIPSTFVLALFPMLSRQAASDRAGLSRAFGLGLKVLLVLALPISVGATLLAYPIIELFAGEAYLPDSAIALQILIWFLPLSFVNGLTQYVLIALNLQRWITISFFGGAIANLLLNVWAIPRYGFVGAAVVTVVSEWVLLFPFWYAIRRELPPVPLLRIAWRPALASVFMGVVVVWAKEFNPWLSIPIGALVYGVALFALGTVTRAELDALRGRATVPAEERSRSSSSES